MSEKRTPQAGAGQRSIQDRPLGQTRRPAAADEVQQSDRPIVRRAPAQQVARPVQQGAPVRTGAVQRTGQEERIPVRQSPARQAAAAQEQSERPQVRRTVQQPASAQPTPQNTQRQPAVQNQNTQRQPAADTQHPGFQIMPHHQPQAEAGQAAAL